MCSGLFPDSRALALVVHFDLTQHLADRFGADPVVEGDVAPLFERFVKLLVGEELTRSQIGIARIDTDVGLEVEHALQVAQ